MDEVVKALTPSFNIVLGALLALGGARYQVWVSNRVQKARLKAEKLERAYMLCQAVYDGHRREINNAKKFLPANPEKYLKNKKHPGIEMSELKMLVRGYAPSLKDSLQTIDNGHEPLKKALRAVENQAIASDPFDPVDLKSKFKIWDEHLEAVSKGSTAIKTGIEEELQKLTA